LQFVNYGFHLSEASRRAGRHVVIISAGRRGADSDAWQELERRHSAHFSFAALEERPAHQISVFLQSVDFGIALTPWQLIGKSGSAAAMIGQRNTAAASNGSPHSLLAADRPPGKSSHAASRDGRSIHR
jgi:hypothetical protein